MMAAAGSVRRGLVEAVFILAGILLAFWIDAWWDRRQTLEMETAMLQSVAREMDRNRDVAGRFLERLDANLDRIDRFLRMPAAALRDLPPDSVLFWIRALPSRASFNADLEATSMLLLTPPVDARASLSIRARLAAWRTLVDEAELLGGQLDDESIRVARLLARHAVGSTADGAEEVPVMVSRRGAPALVQLRADDELVAAVLRKADAQRVHRRFLLDIIESLDSLRAGILPRSTR